MRWILLLSLTVGGMGCAGKGVSRTSTCEPLYPLAESRLTRSEHRLLQEAWTALGSESQPAIDTDVPALVAMRALQDASRQPGWTVESDACSLYRASFVRDALGSAEDLTEAERLATLAGSMAPDDPEIQLLPALQQTGHTRADAIQDHLRRFPAHARAHFAAGRLRLARGEHGESASDHYARAFELGMRGWDARAYQEHLSANHLDRALRMLSAAHPLFGDDGRIAASADPVAAWHDWIGAGPNGLDAVFDTTAGEIRCTLHIDERPGTVAAFRGLALGETTWWAGEPPVAHKRPLYDGSAFDVWPGGLAAPVTEHFRGAHGHVSTTPQWSETEPMNTAFPQEGPDSVTGEQTALAFDGVGTRTAGGLVFTAEATSSYTVAGLCDSSVIHHILSMDRADRRTVPATEIRGVRFEARP